MQLSALPNGDGGRGTSPQMAESDDAANTRLQWEDLIDTAEASHAWEAAGRG